MLAVGDFVRSQQDALSQSDELWHHRLVNDNGGPEEVICSVAFPAHGHRVEVMLTVAMAKELDVGLPNMALFKVSPAPQGGDGLQSSPLCGCAMDERDIRRRVRSMNPIPEAVLEAVELAFHP